MAEEKAVKEHEPHVSKYKKKIVENLVKLMKEYPIVGAINMENMPASSLQSMRSLLRENVVLRMAKRRIMRHAFEAAKTEKKGVDKLVPFLKGMPALLFTKDNPFKLFKQIKKNKTSAPAKAGQEAPSDITVKAGPTPFVPGPVIGELGALGIKSEVKDGKIHIKEDTVVKEGEEIKANLAGILTRLGIEPMEIGLDLTAIYEDGVIYDKKVLDIDEDAFIQSVDDAARWAFNLAVEAGYYIPETVNVLIPKAFREAKTVALEANIMCDAVAEELIGKAERQMLELKNEANIPDAPKEVKPEEKPVEEAPKEVKPEEKPVEEAPKEVKPEEKPVEEAPKEVKPEEKPVEEAPKEVKPEEKPVEEAPKEVKPEEKPVEEAPKEVKPEEKPVEEAPKEVKPEEKPVEEAPKEVKPEEKPVEEAPKEVKPEPVTRGQIIEEEKEIAEDITHIKEDMKEESKHPDIEGIKKIEEEVKEVEEKIEKVEEEKKELPPTEKMIIQEEEKPVERKISEEKKKMAQESEKLFDTLKQKGTLRGVDEDEKKPRPTGPKSPEEIIADAQKKMAEKVPSAHELAKKKK